jgi:hypothetical protein
VIDSLRHSSKKRAARHAFFWFIWISSFTVLQSFGSGIHDYFAWSVYYLITLPLFMAHTYAIAYWLVPKYFFRHHYLVFSVWVVVLLVLASIGELIISNELIWKLVKPENIQSGNYLNGQNILINGLGNEYIIIVFLSVKVVQFWNSKMGEKSELISKKLLAEIELLHLQSYPRFILKVLDRLEHLAETGSPQTSDMIIRLSNLMSSMSSGLKSAKILLYKEIELIRSYSDIQQLILPKNCNLNILVTGELKDVYIPPFLFFQLVEEGYAVLDECNEKTDFTILIRTEPHYLLFSMTSWNDRALKVPFDREVIENCRKYLNYFYPENHKVISNFEINFAEVILEIYT